MRRSLARLLLLALPVSVVIVQACAAGHSATPSTTGAGGDATTGSGGSTTASTAATTTSTATGQGGDGPCTTAAECAGLDDACNTGTCINGACSKLAANEHASCDDGKFCTANDSCLAGVCAGTPNVSCSSNNTCLIGTCDPVTDACVTVPGNDGAGCVDNDPCTLTGICSGGVCTPGQLIDCSFLDGTCSHGVCDQQLGCIVTPLNDGTGCDDGLYCTISDVCAAGACAGVPNTCAAPGNTCMIGTCDEVAKTCIAVPGNNGTACDDGNDCTLNSTCSNGVCSGGVAGNNGQLCDDGDACTSGTHCSNGVCGGAQGNVSMCINDDGCCPAACQGADNDCMDLSGVFAQYAQDGRNVYIWKTPQCAFLPNYTTFCADRGLAWWSPKSQVDAQQLITFAYNLDQTHTWIQTYNSTTTNAGASTVGAYSVVVDGVGCVEGSTTGWTAFRKWACSFCDPESNAQQSDDNQSCCWDKGHPYDWFVCED